MGYMVTSIDDQPVNVWSCHAQAIGEDQDSPCVSGTTSNNCVSAHTGLGCAKCLDYHFRDSTGSCQKCSTTGHYFLLILFLVGSGVAVVIGHTSINSTNYAKKVGTATAVQVVSQVLVSGQVVKSTVSIDLPYPDVVSKFADLLSIFRFDFVGLFQLQCVFGSGTPLEMMLKDLFFVVYVVVVLLLSFIFFQSSIMENLKTKYPQLVSGKCYINTIGAVTSLLFMSLLFGAVNRFRCFLHPDNETESLINHPDIICWDGDDHNTAVIVGCIMIVILIGFLAAYLVALVKLPNWSKTKMQQELQSSRFIFSRFKPTYYFFGIAILIRNFSIASSLIISSRPQTQLILIGACCLIYMASVARFRPWMGKVLNLLDVGLVSAVIVCVFLQMTLVNYRPETATTDDEDARRVAGALIIISNTMLFVMTMGVLLHLLFKKDDSLEYSKLLLARIKSFTTAFSESQESLIIEISAVQDREEIQMFYDALGVFHLEFGFSDSVGAVSPRVSRTSQIQETDLKKSAR